MNMHERRTSSIVPEVIHPAMQEVIHQYGEEAFQLREQNTRAVYMGDIRFFARFLQARGKQSFLEASPDDTASYLSDLSEKGYALATVRRRRDSLSHFLSFAVRQEFIDPPVLESLPRPKIPRRSSEPPYLTQDQVRRLLSEAMESPRDFVFLALAIGTGLRVGELLVLQKRNVVDGGDQLEIQFTGRKGRKEVKRQVELDAETVENVRNYIAPLDEDVYLFRPETGGERGKKNMTRQGMWLALKNRYGEHIEGGFSPVMLRNTYLLERAGLDTRVLAEQLGTSIGNVRNLMSRRRTPLSQHGTVANLG